MLFLSVCVCVCVCVCTSFNTYSFTGDMCEVNIDECASDPCEKGECVDGINAYMCECWPGYEGINCETEINECELYLPCLMGSSCIDQVSFLTTDLFYLLISFTFFILSLFIYLFIYF